MLTCTKCGQSIQAGNRFCGYCGTPSPSVSPPIALQVAPTPPKKPSIQARLILIKGEGFDGVSYQLHAQKHPIGRLFGTIVFPEDRYLSAKHANLYYQDQQLMLDDDGSVNGVFIKLKQPIELQDGDRFLVGEQLLRFELRSSYLPSAHAPKGDGETLFYGCPAEEKLYFRLIHLMRTGQEGIIHYATSPSVNLGREQCDLSFPFDRHISGRHARVYQEGSRFFLQDIGSKNGTFFRIPRPYELKHGDYFFVGQQLMRVEIVSPS